MSWRRALWAHAGNYLCKNSHIRCPRELNQVLLHACTQWSVSSKIPDDKQEKRFLLSIAGNSKIHCLHWQIAQHGRWTNLAKATKEDLIMVMGIVGWKDDKLRGSPTPRHHQARGSFRTQYICRKGILGKGQRSTIHGCKFRSQTQAQIHRWPS